MSESFDNLLFCSQQRELSARLAAAKSLEEIPALASEFKTLLCQVIGQGLGGRMATRLISALSDQLTVKVLSLVALSHRLPLTDWCWLALGSEGRNEQTLISDQDNGLVFMASDEREADALRTSFLPFAQEVNERLAACGYELCPGKIMAGNPQWCLSYDEWREQFIDWVRRPEPNALLNASIFFDLRPLFGQHALGENLRSLILSLTSDTPSFLHLMAANALQAEVPLNFRGEVSVSAGAQLDLKKYGTRIFVDAARIFSLGLGTPGISTSSRLQEAGSLLKVTDLEIAGVNAAFSHLLRFRLDQQLAELSQAQDREAGFRPSSLHDMDKAVLRESLRQARRLQQRLKLNYGL